MPLTWHYLLAKFEGRKSSWSLFAGSATATTLAVYSSRSPYLLGEGEESESTWEGSAHYRSFFHMRSRDVPCYFSVHRIYFYTHNPKKKEEEKASWHH